MVERADRTRSQVPPEGIAAAPPARRLLLVDDGAAVDFPLAGPLAELGWAVDCAGDRAEAEALLLHRDYAAMVVDLRLSPTGPTEALDLVRFVRERRERVRVLLLSAEDAPGVEAEAWRRGTDFFLPRPQEASVIHRLLRAPAWAPRRDGGEREGGRAIERLLRPGSLRTLLQPIVDVAAGPPRVVARECLTRGPAGGNFESAAVLFEYARRCGEEVRLDRACAAQALLVGAATDGGLNVNVHATTLQRDERFAAFMRLACLHAGVRPERVTLEVVEHSVGFDGERFVAAVRELRRVGTRIALDDVGLGQSNYRMILEARPDQLKLDRYLVTGIEGDPRRQAIVRSLVELAAGSGAALVAEGVETRAELRTLRRLGVALVQGYLFGRPCVVEAADRGRASAGEWDAAAGSGRREVSAFSIEETR